MKLSCKSLYAVRALFDLAYHGAGAPAKIEDIARRESVSPRFLEQIFKELKKAGMIASKRGPKGGYFLAQRPDQITIGQVVRLLEGTLCESLKASHKECTSDSVKSPSVEVTHTALQEMAVKISAVLDGVTIQDLARRGEDMGIQREGYKGFIYVI